MPAGFEPFLKHVPAFLLVLFRISGIFVISPVFGSRTIPARIKVLFAFGLAMCVYPAMAPIVGVSPVGTDVHDAAASILEQGTNLSLWTLPAMIAMEISIGAVIGFGASLPMIGFQMSGRVVDQQLGLGLAGVFNPELDEQAGVIGQFYFMFALALFIIMGGHHVLLSILIGSFNTVPLGGFGASSDLLSMLLGLLAIMFELALRVAGPLLCLVFLETAAIGFIARTVPQMNILSIGFPVRILVGVGLLITAIGIEAEVYMDSVQRTLHELATFFGS